jgi:T5SS/PEP-CTERM-associated repeat protein
LYPHSPRHCDRHRRGPFSCRSTECRRHDTGATIPCSPLVLGFCICLTGFAQSACAGITWSGDVDPADPNAWDASTWAYIGDTTNGELEIKGGSRVRIDWGFIGNESGATGAVTVNGDRSIWTLSKTLYVGRYGRGTMTITDGGKVSNKQGFIRRSTSKVTVDGAGSTWMNSSELAAGGTIAITDGGVVSNGQSYIYGVVTVDGPGSTFTNVLLDIENTLNITGGGAVSNNYGWIASGHRQISVVTVDGAGSTWATNTDLYVGYVAPFYPPDGFGTLNITNSGQVSVAGTLAIDDGEHGIGFVNMATGGMLALYGDADDSLAEFLDLIDGSDAIRYWDDSISDWADITTATYGDNYTLDFLTEGDLAGYTMLTVGVPDLSADFDNDGDTDGNDFLTWQRGQSPDPLSAEDLTNWQSNFGAAASSVAASSTTVPEPTAGLLLMLGMATMIFRRHPPA